MKERNDSQNNLRLQQTVKFFETLLRASADGIVITDSAKNIIFVNDTFCKFFSRKRQDMIETNLFIWLEKLDPNARDIWKGLETRVNEHGIAKDVEFVMKNREGKRYFSVNSSLLEKIDIEEAGLIISIWRDETQGKMAKEALQHAHDELEMRVKERTRALLESEQKYRRLFEYSNDIIVQVDKFGKVLAVNNKLKKTLGFTPEEVIGKYFFNIGILEIKELPGIAKQFKKAVVAGKIKDNTGRFLNKLEIKLRAKNGNFIFVETSTAILKKDGKIEGFLTNIRDITQRKQAENILGIQKDIASSLSVAGDTRIILDQVLKAVSRIEGIDSGGIYISDRLTGDLILRAHYGFSSEFVQEVAHYAPDTPQWRLVQTGQPVYFKNSDASLEMRPQARKTEGLRGVAIIPVVQQGRVIGSLNMGSHTLDEMPVQTRMMLETIAGQLREVIARIEAEEKLKDTKNYLNAIIKSSYDSIFVIDEEGTFEFGNEAFFNMMGYPENEFVEQSFMKVIHPGYRDFILKRWDEVKRGEGKPYEVDIIRKDGTVRSLSVSHTDMELGGKRKYCMIAKDITQGKRAEDELRESEEKYRRLVQGSPDAIAIYVDHKIVFANEASARLMRASSVDVLLGRSVIEFVHPDYREFIIQRMIEARKEGKPLPFAAEKFIRLDGSAVDVEVKAIPTTFENKPAVQVIVRDITQRKQAEEALRESEEKFKYVFEHSVAGKSLTLLSGEIHVNQALCEMLGYCAQELKNRKWQEITHPDDVELTRNSMNVLISGEKQSVLFTKRYIHKNGSIVWTELGSALRRDKDGKPLYFITTILDITERKRAEEALQESEEKYRILVERSNDGIVIIQDGVIKFANTHLVQLWGRSMEELLDSPMIRHIHPDERDKVLEHYKRRLANENIPTIYETVLLRKDGTAIYIEINTGVIRYKGKLADLVMVRDIGERKRAQEERIQLLEREYEARTEAEAARKLDHMKSMFLASTSHELRTPLNSVIGFSSMLLEGYSGVLNPEQKEQLEIVHSSGKHLLTLINDIIDISKIEAGNINVDVSEFIIGPIVYEAVSMLRVSLSEKKLDLKVDVEDFVMKSDRTRLFQCIVNLLSNAIKYTEKGSVEITVKIKNNNVIISVIDTGIGIEPKDIPKLFNPFVRLQTPLTYKTSGTGLGLYMVKKLTKDFLGGDVEVESEFGKGSTFTMHVPVEFKGKL